MNYGKNMDVVKTSASATWLKQVLRRARGDALVVVVVRIEMQQLGPLW
jgi:hypothetical protein